MENLRTSVLLILLVVGILLRLDALVLLRARRGKVPLTEGIVLSLVSPIVAMLSFHFSDPIKWDRAREGRNRIWLSLSALGILLCSQIAASWNYIQILLALDQTVARDRFFGPTPDQSSFGPEMVLLMIGLYAAVLVPMLTIYMGRGKVRGLFRGNKVLTTAVLAAAGVVLVQAGAYLLFLAFKGSGAPFSSSLFEPPDGIGDALMLIVALSIVAPLLEEMVFRGAVQLAVTERWGRAVGIFASSFLFALSHMDPFSFLPLFAMGYVLGWARSRSGSILPSYMVHAMNNLAAILWL